MAVDFSSTSASSASSAVQLNPAPPPVADGHRWLSWALGGWIVLMAALAGKSIVEPLQHTVYTTFSDTSRNWWSGVSLYQYWEYSHEIPREYYYSPTFAVAISPLAIWPEWLGGLCWGMGSAVLLLVALRMFYRGVLPSGRWPAAHEGKFLMLALVGSLRSFWSGQSNALIVALVLLGAVAIVRGRWWRGAWCLALPVHIKVWPLAVGGLLGAQWPRRFVPRFAVAVVALGLIPFLTKPAATVAEHYKEWFESLCTRQTSVVRYAGYRDAWTIWEALSSPVNPRAYLALQAAGALAVLGWCLNRGRRAIGYPSPSKGEIWGGGGGKASVPERRLAATRSLPSGAREGGFEAKIRQQLVLTIAAWSSWQLLLGPGTERLTYILIAPALAWGMIASYTVQRGRVWITLAFCATYIFDFGRLEHYLAGISPLALAVQPCGVLIFVGWLLRFGSAPELWNGASSAAAVGEKWTGKRLRVLDLRRPSRAAALAEVAWRFGFTAEQASHPRSVQRPDTTATTAADCNEIDSPIA